MFTTTAAFLRIGTNKICSAPFNFDIEAVLAVFVWRWISATEANIIGWVEGAVNQDNFLVSSEAPSENERFSHSVVDIFRSFNQSVDQISQLNWDNDVQYATFMTALAKLVGNGLARYCELLERMFNKEMDRLTPEQESQLTQSRQEKWVRLAKDALTSKEKVEPFQFLPEVGVFSVVQRLIPLMLVFSVLCQAQRY